MVTRTYYMPRNRVSLHLLNYMASRIGCSIGDIKPSEKADIFRIAITCNDGDEKKIERILMRYDMLSNIEEDD